MKQSLPPQYQPPSLNNAPSEDNKQSRLAFNRHPNHPDMILPKTKPLTKAMNTHLSLVGKVYSVQHMSDNQIQQEIMVLAERLVKNESKLTNIIHKQHQFMSMLRGQVKEIKRQLVHSTDMYSQEMFFWFSTLNASTQQIDTIDHKINAFMNKARTIQQSFRQLNLQIQNLQLHFRHIKPQPLNFSNISSIQDTEKNLLLKSTDATELKKQSTVKQQQSFDKKTNFKKQPCDSQMHGMHSPFEANALNNQHRKSSAFCSSRVNSTEDTNRRLIQHMNAPKESSIWVDQLGFLRRSNSSYIMDPYGNAISALRK